MKVGDKVYRVYRDWDGEPLIGGATVVAVGGKTPNMITIDGALHAWGFYRHVHVDHCHASPLSAAQRYLNECADELTAARQKHTAAIEFVAEVAKGTP